MVLAVSRDLFFSHLQSENKPGSPLRHSRHHLNNLNVSISFAKGSFLFKLKGWVSGTVAGIYFQEASLSLPPVIWERIPPSAQMRLLFTLLQYLHPSFLHAAKVPFLHTVHAACLPLASMQCMLFPCTVLRERLVGSDLFFYQYRHQLECSTVAR